MAKDYVLMSDSDSDLPHEIAREMNIPIVRMPYTLDDQEYLDDNGASGMEKTLFERMRAGSKPFTSLLPTPAYIEYFEPILKEKDLLFLAFSSEMSATFQNVLEAQRELMEKYPNRKFVVVDTLSISVPQSLLVMEAHKLYEKGASMEEVIQWVEANRLKAHAWFTVGDLVYLRRGGRISSTSAMVGTMLDIKPILTLTKAGKLEAFTKVQGRKKAMKALVEKVAKYIQDPGAQSVVIMHGDIRDEAEIFKTQLKNRIPEIRDIKVQFIGPVIGAHAGPGTLAVCFMGKERPV
ncbi:MAG: DegV family protein [Clostridiales bacterium]|jgi:DegV family protein with EDD domain|nr:DegV family protein [Clostridiales bacterium]